MAKPEVDWKNYNTSLLIAFTLLVITGVKTYLSIYYDCIKDENGLMLISLSHSQQWTLIIYVFALIYFISYIFLFYKNLSYEEKLFPGKWIDTISNKEFKIEKGKWIEKDIVYNLRIQEIGKNDNYFFLFLSNNSIIYIDMRLDIVKLKSEYKGYSNHYRGFDNAHSGEQVQVHLKKIS